MSFRILLADDHVIVRQGIKSLLEKEGFQVVGEAGDGREAIRLTREVHPDFAILDLSMPQLNGMDAAREIRKISPHTKTLLLTLQKEVPYVAEAFRAGLNGYVVKSQGAEELIQAIRQIACGGVYVSPTVSEAVNQAKKYSDSPPDPLTPREREILQLIAEGKSTKEISASLGVSFNTVESHRTRIMKKLKIHSRAGLVRYAVRRCLIQP